MTRFKTFIAAIDATFADAGYDVVEAPEDLQQGSALVLPTGETDARDSVVDGFTPMASVIIGAAHTRDYTQRASVIAALDKATTLLWESPLVLPETARVLVRPNVGGVLLGTDEQPLVVIIIAVSAA